jgi:hypothetical protein
MNQSYLVCPNCYKRIELTEAASQQIEERIRKETAQDTLLHAQIAERAKELDLERDYNGRLKQEKIELDRDLAEARAEIFDLQKRQIEFEAKEREIPLQMARALDEERKNIWDQAFEKAKESLSDGFNDLRGIQLQVARALEEERGKFWEETRARAKDPLVAQIEDLKIQLAERGHEVQRVRDQEFRLRQRQRELDERETEMQNVIRRSIDQERKKIWDAALAKAEESWASEINDLRDLQQELARSLELERQRTWESAMATAQKQLHLQVARTLDEERNKLWEFALARVQDSQPAGDAERHKQLAGMLRRIESLIDRAGNNGAAPHPGTAPLMDHLDCRVDGPAMQEFSPG